MRGQIFSRFWVVFLVIGGCWSLIGCDSTSTSRKTTPAKEESTVVQISGNQVGEFLIGKSTLIEVLGEDNPEARKRLISRGLNCEFDEEGILSAVTITSDDYAFSDGLAVGSLSTEVRAKLGDPIETSFQSGQLKFSALVYDRLAFLLDDENSVYAIRIGK